MAWQPSFGEPVTQFFAMLVLPNISLSIRFFILFSKLISVCYSVIRRKKTSIIALCILILFATVLNHLSHGCSLWKLQRNTLQSTNNDVLSLSNCYIQNNAINKPTLRKYVILKIKKTTWQNQCLINRQCLKVYCRFWKLKLWWVCKTSLKLIRDHWPTHS